MLKKILHILCYPWRKYQENKAWKAKLKELRKRDPFIYK
jgi:hypothetical protein